MVMIGAGGQSQGPNSRESEKVSHLRRARLGGEILFNLGNKDVTLDVKHLRLA